MFGECTASNNAAWLRRKLAERPDIIYGQGRCERVRARDAGAAIWTDATAMWHDGATGAEDDPAARNPGEYGAPGYGSCGAGGCERGAFRDEQRASGEEESEVEGAEEGWGGVRMGRVGSGRREGAARPRKRGAPRWSDSQGSLPRCAPQDPYSLSLQAAAGAAALVVEFMPFGGLLTRQLALIPLGLPQKRIAWRSDFAVAVVQWYVCAVRFQARACLRSRTPTCTHLHMRTRAHTLRKAHTQHAVLPVRSQSTTHTRFPHAVAAASCTRRVVLQWEGLDAADMGAFVEVRWLAFDVPPSGAVHAFHCSFSEGLTVPQNRPCVWICMFLLLAAGAETLCRPKTHM